MAVKIGGMQRPKEAPYTGSVPSIWKGHIVQISNLFQRLEAVSPSSSEYKGVNRQIFQCVSLLYRQCTSAVPKAFDNDLCFSRAEEVACKGLFSSYPGSENRLKPLAINYLDVYSRFQSSIVDQSPDVLSMLHDLAQAHQIFLRQYGAEIRQVRGNDGSVIAETHEIQVRQGVTSFLYAIGQQDHSVFEQMAAKIEERDPVAILLLPNLLVYFLACKPQQAIPGFLTKYAAEIGTLRNQVKGLSSEELTRINRSLFGEEVQLSLEAHEALKKIKEIGTLCHRDEQAQHASGFLDALLISLDRVLASTGHTMSSLRQHAAIISEHADLFSRLNPYEQTALLWIISDQPFSQTFLSKRSSLPGFEQAKDRFAQLPSEEQSEFIISILKKEEISGGVQKMLKGDFDYFANKLNVGDEGGLLVMQMRLALKQFSSR